MRVVVQSWSPTAFEQWKSVVMGPGFRLAFAGTTGNSLMHFSNRPTAFPPLRPADP
jgi:hypothetical protein